MIATLQARKYMGDPDSWCVDAGSGTYAMMTSARRYLRFLAHQHSRGQAPMTLLVSTNARELRADVTLTRVGDSLPPLYQAGRHELRMCRNGLRSVFGRIPVRLHVKVVRS